MSATFPSLRVESGLIGPELIDEIADGQGLGQAAPDFNFSDKSRLLDKFSIGWGQANDQWKVFQRALANAPAEENCSSLTRTRWMMPLLDSMRIPIIESRTAPVLSIHNP